MSAEALRNTVKADIAELVQQFGAQLAESTAAPLDKMREWQGTIAGLKLAAGKLDERYRENR